MKRARLLAFALGVATTILPAQPHARRLRRPGDNGPAIKAQIDGPSNLAVDARGNIYVYEFPGDIRRIDASTHKITTVAEECDRSERKPILTGCFEWISSLRVIGSGSLLLAEFIHNRVSVFDPVSRRFTVIAGNGDSTSSGDGGLARDAGVTAPYCLALNGSGDIFVCDSSYCVRRIDSKTGAISTVAGSGKRGFAGDGGPALKAQFVTPQSVAVDPQGNFFVADDASNRIRRVDANTGIIETYAGVGAVPPRRIPPFSGEGGPAVTAGIPSPRSLALDREGNLFFLTGARVCRIDRITGILSTVAGTGGKGYSGDGGLATAARIGAEDLTIDNEGNLFIAEFASNRIRRIDAKTGIITTVAGNGLPNTIHVSID